MDAAYGGFPRAEFFASTMPRLPPSLGTSSPYGGGNGAGGNVSGGGSGGDGGDGAVAESVGVGCAVNVLAMERLGDNLMSLSQVSSWVRGER